jgi:hypothetical protein
VRAVIAALVLLCASCAAVPTKAPPTAGTTSHVIAVSLDGQVKVFVFITKDGRSRPQDADKCAKHPECVQLVQTLHDGGQIANIELVSNEPDDGSGINPDKSM